MVVLSYTAEDGLIIGKVKSDSREIIYDVMIDTNAGVWRCSCESAKYRPWQMCKHVRQLLERIRLDIDMEKKIDRDTIKSIMLWVESMLWLSYTNICTKYRIKEESYTGEIMKEMIEDGLKRIDKKLKEEFT